MPPFRRHAAWLSPAISFFDTPPAWLFIAWSISPLMADARFLRRFSIPPIADIYACFLRPYFRFSSPSIFIDAIAHYADAASLPRLEFRRLH
jgi:hypothetical protein